jgi:hypothetical protein
MKQLPHASATGEHPQRYHRREIEGRDAGHHAQGLAYGIAIDPIGDVLSDLALEQVGSAGCELHHFHPSSDFASGVGQRLAVLGCDHRREFSNPLLHDVEEAIEDASAPQGCCARPGRNAFVAAATASPTSAAVAKYSKPVCSPVAGLNTGAVLLPSPKRQVPAMKCGIARGMTLAPPFQELSPPIGD